jgi:RNA polymerase sigma factor (sigma-70 family)
VPDDVTTRLLVASAAAGDQQAWDGLVDSFGGLVWSVIRSHGFYGADGSDISQTVWLRFVEHVGRLREPERAGAWLATTARHECLRMLRRQGRTVAVADPPEPASPAPPIDTALLAAEDHASLLDALERVPPRCRELLRLLLSDPPLSYDDISAALDMPKGSIGPTRQRCLDHVRAVLGRGSIKRPGHDSVHVKEDTP